MFGHVTLESNPRLAPKVTSEIPPQICPGEDQFAPRRVPKAAAAYPKSHPFATPFSPTNTFPTHGLRFARV